MIRHKLAWIHFPVSFHAVAVPEYMPETSATESGFREDARFRVLKLLEDQPDLSQRDIATKLGVSLGAVNYCIHGLIEKGSVKSERFFSSGKKWKYAYVLTPKGIVERAGLASRFLQRRVREYEALRREIEALESEIDGMAVLRDRSP